MVVKVLDVDKAIQGLDGRIFDGRRVAAERYRE